MGGLDAQGANAEGFAVVGFEDVFQSTLLRS